MFMSGFKLPQFIFLFHYRRNIGENLSGLLVHNPPHISPPTKANCVHEELSQPSAKCVLNVPLLDKDCLVS